MKLTTLPFRQALIAELDGNVIYNTNSIRVFEEYYMPTATKTKVILTGGVEAYIVIKNQTSNEARSNKCNRNNNDSIQIQVVTVWPANKGGSKVAEEIANVILSRLFPTSIKNTDLSLSGGLSMWKSELLGSVNINLDGDSSRTWITQLILEAWISQ